MSITDESLDELLALKLRLDHHYNRTGDMDFILAGNAIMRLRELAALREGADAARWVEWKAGDAMPADGAYWITQQRPSRWDEFGDAVGFDPPTVRPLQAQPFWWINEDVIAYWSIPLPPPFSPGAAHE